MENHKLIIWGLGHVGKSAVRQIVQRESLELVAVYDNDESKIGQDAGLLSGVEELGVEVSGFHFVHKVHDKMQPLPSRKTKIEFKGEVNTTIDFSTIFTKQDVFLTSAVPGINLIPQLVAAQPGFWNALDLPVGHRPK